jgi:hypothetical protein
MLTSLNPLKLLERCLMQEVTEFFQRYQSLFDQQNWTAFAALFHEPALSVRGDGSVMTIATHAEGARLYAAVAQTWRSEGYARFEMQDFDILRMGCDSCLVSFDWRMLREDGSLVRRWRQSYQLIQLPQGWRVLSSTFHRG